MGEIPEAMMANGRQPDDHFDPDEDLYRRFSPEWLDGTTVDVAAIELPDMSVNRSKYGLPEWTLLAEGCENWGVAAFKVSDFRQELLHLGEFEYAFEAMHRPHRRNYPHSEIWAYKDGEHIDLNHSDQLDPEPHLRWREQLAWRIRVVIQPTQ